MKRFFGFKALVFLSAALLLGTTQCKKEVNTINDEASEGVEITLTIGDGSRADVNPTGHTNPDYATVEFEDGDTLFVGHNKQYVGCLTYVSSKSRFEGKINITEAVGEQPLHFYYLGGKGYKSSEVNNNSVSVDISDQGVIDVADGVHRYPIISYAPSNEDYSSGTNGYSARLLNKCAMVKFNVVKPTGYDKAGTCIMGMNNRVSVSFDPTSNEDDGFTYGQVNGGAITIDSKIGDVWAILLPQGETAASEAFSGRRKGTQPAMPAIHANDYIANAITLNLNTEFAPTGVVAGKADALYKIGDNKYVLFSKASLKATTTDSWATWTWGFKDTQYEYETAGQVGTNYSNRTTVSLFGWATSGFYGSIEPNRTTGSAGDYGPQANMTGRYAKCDWGYNKITNGAYKQWRCLTAAEWQYLVANNPHKDTKIITAEGNRKGVVILPYGHDVSEIHSYSAGYTVEEWATAETTLGAIFLPNAGNRSNTSSEIVDVDIRAEFWSSTWEHEFYAYTADFYYGDGHLTMYSRYRGAGYAVRLVCE